MNTSGNGALARSNVVTPFTRPRAVREDAGPGAGPGYVFEDLVGAAPVMRGVLARVQRVAPTDATVLITGETGTGKELIARAIRSRSRRAAGPFVSINCAATPGALIASELFGHERGAFTGALQRRLGRFELAHGGTLFLDEVGELPLETQIALLRVLQEREFERVGGSQPIRTDVRIVAATNRDLQAAIAAGTFRSDLYYRLNVFPIELPPLRERREDVRVLAAHFLERYARRAGKTIRTIDARSLQLLDGYAWPGNVRELENVIERSVILCDGDVCTVDPRWLVPAPAALAAVEAPVPLFERLASQERAIIEAALAATNGRVSGPRGAAARLGLPASTLDSKIRTLRISKHAFKALA